MKRLPAFRILFMGAALVLVSLLFAPVSTQAQAGVSISFQTFYDQLSPDGSWVNTDDGYVWVPNAGPSFRPYATNGHWVYSDDGWVWVSDYRWGWAAFHYGRWRQDPSLGWCWLPDTEWAPAWVVWGNYSDRYCWAPLGPHISFSASFGWNPPAAYWVSCPRQYIGVGGFQSHVIVNNVSVVRNITVIRNNTINNRTVNYHPGPARADVQRYTHTNIQPAHIVAGRAPGADHASNGSVSLYRPTVQRGDARTVHPAAVQPRENVHQNRIVNPAVKPQPVGAAPAHLNVPAARPGQPAARPGQPAATPRPATNPAAPRPNIPARTNTPRPQQPVRTNPSPAPAQQPARPAETVRKPVDNTPRQMPHPQQRPTPTPPQQRPANPAPQQRPAPQPRPVQPPQQRQPQPQAPRPAPAPQQRPVQRMPEPQRPAPQPRPVTPPPGHGEPPQRHG